jgi:hypothetical protein
MKTQVFIIIFISCVIANTTFSQIPNNGFENWTNMGTYITPDNWANLNAVTYPAAVFTCMKGIPGNPGNAYLKLITKPVSGMGTLPGIAVCGILNPTTFKAVSGFAYSSRPATLKGNWQYMAYGADQGYIGVYLTKWNPATHARDTIGRIGYPLPGMVMSWQSFSLPLTYFSSGLPDSAMIILSASGTSPVTQSYLYIDNLFFQGGTVGLDDLSEQSYLKIYPNPVVSGRLTIDLINSSNTASSVEIMDLRGRPVLIDHLNYKNFPHTVDVSALHSGVYLLRINSIGGILYSRFIKN